jgi:hypothetical protein
MEARSKLAASRIRRNLSKQQGEHRGGEPQWARHHVAAEKRVSRVTKTEAQQRLSAIRREARERERTHRQLLNEVNREERRAARESARIEREKTRLARREALKKQRELERFSRRTSHRATRFMTPNMPMASMMRRGAMDLAHGAGIETNLGGIFGRVVESDRAARELAVKGYIEGDQGPAGTRQDPTKLREEARALGEELGMATDAILEGESAFVDLRGNLAGARDIARDMARLSRSQGANYRDIMYMAGKAEAMFAGQAEYANDEKKKREAIVGLMRTTVYEAKKYSIPVAQMAKEFPKIAGIASTFEGDVGRNVVQMMGTAQMAEAGAAKNPATASTYVQNLALAITKKAGKFEKIAGVNVFSDKEKNKLKSFQEIITSTIAATEKSKRVRVRGRGVVEMNQLQQLQEIMPNKRAYLALQKYLDIFTEAGGGKKGVAAVNAVFEDTARGVGSQQIDSDLAMVLGGTEAKAKQFNQQLEKVVAGMEDDLLPAVAELAPKVLEAVKAFGGLVSWMARNPGLTISTAISASIARAGLESVLRASIERAVMGTIGPGGTYGAGGAKMMGKGQPFLAGGPLGIASAALTITATAVTLYAAGTVAIDWGMDLMGKAQSKQEASKASIEANLSTIRRFRREGKDIPQEVLDHTARQRAELASRIKEAEGRSYAVGPIHPATLAANWAGGWENLLALGKGTAGLEGGKTFQQVSQGREDVAKLDELKQQMAQLESTMRGELKVNVTNMPDKPLVPSDSGRDDQ